MRTTLILNDALAEAAKKRAAERKTSLSAFVNEALRFALRESETGERPSEPFRMPTYAPPNSSTHSLSPEEIHDLLAAEELEPYRS